MGDTRMNLCSYVGRCWGFALTATLRASRPGSAVARGLSFWTFRDTVDVVGTRDDLRINERKNPWTQKPSAR